MSTETKTATDKAVYLWRAGQFVQFRVADLQESDWDDLAQILYTVKHVADDDPEHGCRIARHWQSLFSSFGPEREHVQVYGGLLPVLEEWLTQRGYRIYKADFDMKALPEPRLWDTGPTDSLLLSRLGDSQRQIVRYDNSRVRVARLVDQIAYAWPNEEIMIWTASDKKALKLYDEMRTPFKSLVAGDHSTGDIGRVVIATHSSLCPNWKRDIDIEDRGICIALDAHQLVMRPDDPLVDARSARMIGLVPVGVHLPPIVRDRITAIFGFETQAVPEHGRLASQTAVARVKSKGSIDLSDCQSAFALKQAAIWSNTGRNRHLAWLARAVHRNSSKLQKQYPALGEQIGLPTARNVAILVENANHVFELARELPEAGVVVGDLAPQVLNGFARSRMRRLENLEGGLRIVSHAGSADIDSCDVLIVADALAGNGGATDSTNVGGIEADLVVDVQDANHPVLRKWAKQRWERYRENGFRLLERRKTPWERWMNTRPEVEELHHA